jgi:hypothetical protein
VTWSRIVPLGAGYRLSSASTTLCDGRLKVEFDFDADAHGSV